MGIHLMENFDIAETDSTAIATLLNSRGFVMSSQGSGGTFSIQTFTENGVSRKCLRITWEWSDGFGARWLPIKIPVPSAAAPYYVSFRLRLPYAATINNLMHFAVSATSAFAYNTVMAYIRSLGSNLSTVRAGIGSGGNPYVDVSVNNFHTVEVYRAANGTMKVWIDDLLLTSAQTVLQSADNYLYLGPYRDNSYFNGKYGWDIADVVVIDPSTPGLQYRPGKSGRVLGLQYSGDVVTDWTAAPGVTTPHNQLMSSVKATPDANSILSALEVGKREQYSIEPVPAAFGSFIHAVRIMPQVLNAGAAMHSLAIEMDTGSGIFEAGTMPVAPGAGYSTTPVSLATKPDGSAWTTADLATAKVGFSVKS